MNFKKFFAMQHKFDNKVVRQLAIQKPTLAQKCTALLTEIGEFANDEGSVKYWKRKKKQDLQSALFEFIDMLKFAISIAKEVGITFKEANQAKLIYYPSMNEQLIALSYSVAMIAKFPDVKTKQLYMVTVFGLLKGVQAHCSFTDAKVFDAWNLKHEENVKRLKEQVAA